jgi:hypothetical protein
VLVRAFLKFFGITKEQGRKKELNLLKIERATWELPATATPQIVADVLGVSKRTLERYLADEWGESFHDMQARIHGKPKPSRMKAKFKKKTKKKRKMF